MIEWIIGGAEKNAQIYIANEMAERYIYFFWDIWILLRSIQAQVSILALENFQIRV